MARLAPLAASGELDEDFLLAEDHALAKECSTLARIVAINAEARRFFTDEDGTLGPGTEPGSSIDPNFHEEGWRVFARELLARVRGELPFEGELALIMPRGEERTITIRVSVPPEARSTLARVFVSFLDVTRQKRAEAELLRSLADNQALIRDLRYRTMNNMQMISSMLRFEEERAPDERSAAAFRSINERIEAKAMVHETLSSNGELRGSPSRPSPRSCRLFSRPRPEGRARDRLRGSPGHKPADRRGRSLRPRVRRADLELAPARVQGPGVGPALAAAGPLGRGAEARGRGRRRGPARRLRLSRRRKAGNPERDPDSRRAAARHDRPGLGQGRHEMENELPYLAGAGGIVAGARFREVLQMGPVTEGRESAHIAADPKSAMVARIRTSLLRRM